MQIVIAPNKVLREKTKPVKKITPQLLKTVGEMIKLMNSFKDPEGVGLAATQIGILEQFFIAKFEEEIVQVFNPKITYYSKRERTFMEGCLSIPDYYAYIKRPGTIKVEYMDKTGRIFKKILKGTNARIFQHEYDHLHGKLFMDLVLEQKAKLYKLAGKDKTGADVFEEVRI